VVEKRNGINVLGLLLFCIFFGVIISRLKEKAIILKKFFEAMLEVVMQLVRIAMLYVENNNNNDDSIFIRALSCFF
jgi:Na+/H+-dicarboxylate symporter